MTIKTPTDEQLDCISMNVPNLVVKAFAGAGKTSMLTGFAQYRPNDRMLYIVLNKSVQLEAIQRFEGTLVKPMTSHGLAFKKFGKNYQRKLVTSLKPYTIIDLLKLEGELGGTATRNDALAFGGLILETLNRFLYSPDPEFIRSHAAPDFKNLSVFMNDRNVSNDDLRSILILKAEQIWRKMCDTSSTEVGMLHDGYLKLFQLSEPRLSEEYILLDEAQDANPCVLQIMLAQESSKVFVGDSHQAIYSWRGSRNALTQAMQQGGTARYLTGSFRFGENIAKIANMILRFTGENLPVRGLGGEDQVGEIPKTEPRAIISRSNAGIFSYAVDALHNRKKYWFLGGVAGYRLDIIQDVYLLSRKKRDEVRDPFIRSFGNFAELREYANEVNDFEIRSRCHVVDEYGAQIPVLIRSMTNNVGAASSMEEAQTILSTTHKSKGFEFTNVLLAEDFIELNTLQDTARKLTPEERKNLMSTVEEEINILYVAATRAKKVLQLNSDLKILDRKQIRHKGTRSSDE